MPSDWRLLNLLWRTNAKHLPAAKHHGPEGRTASKIRFPRLERVVLVVLVVLVLVLVLVTAAAADGGPGAGAGGPAATKNCPRNKFPIAEKMRPGSGQNGRQTCNACRALVVQATLRKRAARSSSRTSVTGVVVGVKATSFSLAPSALLPAGVGGFTWHKHVNQFSGV